MKPLIATAIIMTVLLILFSVGVAVDPHMWLKPAKFAVSSAIFTGTMAWLYGNLLTKRLGWLIALAINVEVAIIAVQAARGTTSHYNQTTTLNTILFALMGIFIAVLLCSMIAVFYRSMREPTDWALRLGLLITIIGSLTGGIMIGASAHTIGAADGGPGIPGLDWSLNYGDLRVAHFFGLHALQIIPLIAYFWRRPFAISASYMTFIVILTWQALRGESVAHPGVATLTALGIWLIGTLAATQVKESVYAA
jgi:hypothetical protein